MLRMLGNQRQFCDGVTRREAMTVGALSVLGGAFNLPSLLALEERRGAGSGKAKSVMLLYLHGGAPTQDMYDLKPSAPVEVRGEFKPIATNVPGMQICEHLPLSARWMHRSAIVRTVNHKAGCHNTLPGFTGNEQPVNINDPNPKDSFPPGMGAVCEYLKPPAIELPHYVALPNHLLASLRFKRPGPWGGFLGKRYDPLCSDCKPVLDPKPAPGRLPMWLGTPFLADTSLAPDMTIDRLNGRRSLLTQLEEQQRQADAEVAAGRYSRVQQRAFSMLTGSKLRTAFDLDAEDPRQRDRYGRHLFGQSVLIARRLIETGVRFVDVYWDYWGNGQTYWDTHSNNFITLKQSNLPALDQTFDALLADLQARGLLDETLVVVMSDFGRTPRVNGSAGRDHWTYCYSVVLAGAGIRGGTVCGASDGHAAYVKDRPVRPADICSTIYQCLGIDPETTIPDRDGRPVAISQGGEPVREILA